MSLFSFQIYRDAEELAFTLARELAVSIQSAISAKGSCHMVFPGGSSARRSFEQLALQNIAWEKLHLYPSDERCVPRGHADRNDLLIEEVFAHTKFPAKNLHRIPAELGAHAGAAAFSEFLQQVPSFDLVLLGMGDDGHTASLFPHHPALTVQSAAVAVEHSPKLPAERVSISLPRLRGGALRYVLAHGAAKCAMVQRIQSGEVFPITKIDPHVFFLDVAAAGKTC